MIFCDVVFQASLIESGNRIGCQEKIDIKTYTTTELDIENRETTAERKKESERMRHG